MNKRLWSVIFIQNSLQFCIKIQKEFLKFLNILYHKRTAYTAFLTKAPPGRKKIIQKEQPVMVKKPSLSIHIELYII